MRKTYYRSKWAEPAKYYCSEIKGFSSLCPRAFTSEHLLNFIQNGGRSISKIDFFKLKTMGHTKPTCTVISNSNRGKYWELNPLS